VDSVARTRQRTLAVFLPAAAALYMSAEGLNPKGTDKLITTTATASKLLPIAAKHPTQLYLSGSLSVLALGALAVAYAAIATLVRRRGAALATIAAVIGGFGMFAGAIVNVLVGFNLAAAASAHIPQAAAAQFLVTTFNSGAGQAFLYSYALAQYLAPVLMAIALWRSRNVPRWLAILFALGLEIAEAQSSHAAISVLCMLPFLAAMVVLTSRIWQQATLPASQGLQAAIVITQAFISSAPQRRVALYLSNWYN
jgi:hypothetical protein